MASKKHFQANVSEIAERLSNHVQGLSTVSLKPLILRLAPQIRKGLSQGMTYKDIAFWLRNQGIECSPSTVRYYMPKTHDTKNKAKKKHSLKALRPPMPPHLSSTVAVPKGFKTINDEEL